MKWLRFIFAKLGILDGREITVSVPITWTGYQRMANYFTDDEVKGLDKELIAKLDTARKAAGVAFKITSGLRSCAANTAALGVEGSAHLKGLAVDLSVDSGTDRFLMVKGLLAAGFVRLGIYTAHVHVDLDETKPQEVIWIGISH